jgi:hypothetical protein
MRRLLMFVAMVVAVALTTIVGMAVFNPQRGEGGKNIRPEDHTPKIAEPRAEGSPSVPRRASFPRALIVPVEGVAPGRPTFSLREAPRCLRPTTA